MTQPTFSRRSRIVRVALIAVTLGAALAACGQRETFEDEVRAAIAKTRVDSNAFVYSDARSDRNIEVTGFSEDDFRFKALVKFNGAPAYEQVVRDDTLAVRFLNPSTLRDVLSPKALEADLTTDLEGFNVLQVLRSGRWVVDDAGAPLLTAVKLTLKDIGRDPVLDAITALDYVDAAVRDAITVDRWSDDSLDPTYPTSEDPFPKPEKGSGVQRYDLRRPDLPPVSETTGDAQGVALPNINHFRKMAIYVKDGRVIQVIERIEANGKRLQQLEDYMRRALNAFNVDEAFKQAFNDAVASATNEADLASTMFAALNTALVGLGQDPIITRSMSLSFPDSLPAGVDTVIEAPTGDDVVTGSLAALATSTEGQAAFQTREETSDGSGADGSGSKSGDGGADSTGAGQDGTTDAGSADSGSSDTAPEPPPSG